MKNRLSTPSTSPVQDAVARVPELTPHTVPLTARFVECAASWQLTPEELARRVCEDFERENPPGSPVIFVLDKRGEDA